MSPNPILVTNPRDDQSFANLAQQLIKSGIRSASDLEVELQKTHSNVHVRPRSLSAELVEIWYVYRDGSWVGSSPLEADIKANSENLVADAALVASLEAEAAQEPVRNSRAMELAKETEAVVGRMSHTARIQSQLVEEFRSETDVFRERPGRS